MQDITLHYVSQTEALSMPEEVLNYVRNNSNFVQVRQKILHEISIFI